METKERERQAALCRYLLTIGRIHAGRNGITGEVAEDCAVEFVERMLQPQRIIQWANLEGGALDTYLYAAAGNHTKNTLRRLRRQSSHEIFQPGTGEDAARHLLETAARAAGDPDTALYREVVLRQVYAAIDRLTPYRREVFTRYYLGGESTAELAAAYGKTEEAIRRCLSYARKEIQADLLRNGWTEADLRAAISPPPPRAALHTTAQNQTRR